MLLGQKKEVLKNFSTSKFSKGVCPWILSKIELFIIYYVFWGGKSSKKRLFFGVLDKKESFLDQKKKVLKKYNRFCQKIDLFIVCVFWAHRDREDRFFYYSG